MVAVRNLQGWGEAEGGGGGGGLRRGGRKEEKGTGEQVERPSNWQLRSPSYAWGRDCANRAPPYLVKREAWSPTFPEQGGSGEQGKPDASVCLGDAGERVRPGGSGAGIQQPVRMGECLTHSPPHSPWSL